MVGMLSNHSQFFTHANPGIPGLVNLFMIGGNIMTPKERVKLGQHVLEAFHYARELEKQIQSYKEAPIKYEQSHPGFDIDETIRLYQEFMDEFDKTYTQLQEDYTDGKEN